VVHAKTQVLDDDTGMNRTRRRSFNAALQGSHVPYDWKKDVSSTIGPLPEASYSLAEFICSLFPRKPPRLFIAELESRQSYARGGMMTGPLDRV